MHTTKATSVNSLIRPARTLGCYKLLALLSAAVLLTACSSARKEIVTYHVEFVVDGTPYSGVAKFARFYAQNFEYSFSTINFNKELIHGALKDGTKYIVSFYNVDLSKLGRVKINSRVFLQITPALVESFDKVHTHSQYHNVNIISSYIIIGNSHRVWYHDAVDAQRVNGKSTKGAAYYYTVGAKITPFENAKEAIDDYDNIGPSPWDTPATYKKPKFNFHVFSAYIQNSDADITYAGGVFHVMFPSSKLATTWVLAPNVHVENGAIYGHVPDIFIWIQKRKVTIPSITTANSGIDPSSGKAIVFYEDNASLNFR